MIELKEGDLNKLLDTRNCVFFLGSAISMQEPSCLPDGQGLKKLAMRYLCRGTRDLDTLVDKCFPSNKLVNKGDRLAQSMSELMPEVILQACQDIIGAHAKRALKFCELAKFNANHLCIAHILKRNRLRHGKTIAVTTNFDCLLENAMESIGLFEQKDFQVHSANDEFNISGDSVIDVFKLHGTIRNEETIATTLRDVGSILPKKKADLLRFILSNYTVFFIGYSGRDLDIYPIIIDCGCKEICWLVRPKSKPKLQAETVIAKFDAKVCIAELNELFRNLNQVFNFGIQHQKTGFNDDFVKDHLDKWSNAIKTGDKVHIVGNVMRHIGELQKSVQLLEWLRTSSQHATRRKRVNRLNSLGTTYTDSNNWKNAEEVFQESLGVAQAIGYKEGIGIAKGGRALCFYKQDAWKKATILFKESLKLLEDNKADERDIIRIKLGLGLTYHKQKLTDKAIEYLKPIVEPVSNITDIQTVIQARRILGLAYYQRAKGKDLAKALAHQKEALELSRKIEDNWGVAQATNNMALIYRKQGKLDDAVKYHKTNLLNRKRLQDIRGMGQTLYNVGVSHTDKAVESYQKAIGYYRKVESPQTQDILTAYERLGKLFLSLNRLEESIRLFAMSVKKRTQMLEAGEEDPHNLANVMGELGHALLLNGDSLKAAEQYKRLLIVYQRMSHDDLAKFTGLPMERHENAERHLKVALGVFTLEKDETRIRDFLYMIKKIESLRSGVK